MKFISGLINFIITLVLGAALWVAFGILSTTEVLPAGCLEVYTQVNSIINSVVTWIVEFIKGITG